MGSNYKYNPDDYKGILFLSEELDAFYKAHKVYTDNMTDEFKRLAFEIQGKDLFFVVKHREVEGILSQAEADEFREHMRDLLND